MDDTTNPINPILHPPGMTFHPELNADVPEPVQPVQPTFTPEPVEPVEPVQATPEPIPTPELAPIPTPLDQQIAPDPPPQEKKHRKRLLLAILISLLLLGGLWLAYRMLAETTQQDRLDQRVSNLEQQAKVDGVSAEEQDILDILQADIDELLAEADTKTVQELTVLTQRLDYISQTDCVAALCVLRQATSPGTQQEGNINIDGDIISASLNATTVTALNLVGDGASVTNVDAITLEGNNTSYFTDASNISTGTLSVARGGTGLDGSAAGNGQLLIGNGSGYTLATISAGAGISVTNGAGAITIANTGAAAACDTTSNYICNGGNTLGATVTIGTNDAQELRFETNGSDRLTIQSDGDVGIGTTSPSGRLEVMSASGSNAELYLTADAKENNSDQWRFAVRDVSGGFSLDDFSTAAWLSRLFVQSNTGNVGIGTATPGSLLSLGSDAGTAASGLTFGSTGDTNLYRRAANTLHTDDTFTASGEVRAQHNTATQTRIGSLGPSGEAGITFGQAGDTNLYRSAANTLKTDDTLSVVGNILTDDDVFVRTGAAAEVVLGARGPANQAGLTFGSARDTNLYRLSANFLMTDDRFGVNRSASSDTAFSAIVSGDAASRFTVNADGAITWGGGAGALDTNLYRSAANTLRTDDAFTTGGIITAGAVGSADTLVYLCRNAANQLATCLTSGTGAAFVQGGNSFGATATLGTNDTQELRFETNGSDRLTIQTDGDVGIGTTSPTAPLEIFRNTGAAVATVQRLSYSNAIGAGAQLDFGVTGGVSTGRIENVLDSANNASLRLYSYKSGTGIIEVMRLDSTGNVGIGDATPDFKLELEGTSSVTDRKIGINNTQVVYLPDQATFTGSLFYGNGGQNLSHSAGADGYYNTGLGIYALNNNTTGYFNTASGYAALVANTTGYSNTATGFNSLQANTTGLGNTANGASSLVFNTIGSNNTATGASALYSNTTGSNATANGYAALYLNTTGGNNTATGFESLRNNSTGSNNTANGFQALYYNTTGEANTSTGAGALYSNTTGSRNTAVGVNALYSNTTGGENTALGYAALQSNTTGANNTASGRDALQNNTTGVNNTANGFQALFSNTTGNNNVAVGVNSLYANTSASNNTATGLSALYSNTTGSSNTANGWQALYSNTTGTSNTAVGVNALYFNTTGSYNTASGYTALYSNSTGNYNTANGYFALNANTTGNGNTANGYYALSANTTGAGNTATGFQALTSNTTGGSNTANGYQAMRFNTTGTNNTAMGQAALHSNTTGSNNTATGLLSLYSNTTGGSNTANGQAALYSNTTGSNNTAAGNSALYSNTTGDSNTATGLYALRYNTTGSSNTAHGREALLYNTTGNNNTANGYQALLNSGKTVTAGSFVVGIAYTIQSTGTTDFTLIGAADSNVGTVFTATGVGSGTGTASSNTNDNTATGSSALNSNTTGYGNTANGAQALQLNTTGSRNTASGYRALYSNTTGSANTATGEGALRSNTSGNNNTATGFRALYSNSTGAQNTTTGYSALYANTTGSHNTANGYLALYSNTTGNYNTAFGNASLQANTTGQQNVAIGHDALNFNTTGSSNVASGAAALYSNTTGADNTATGRSALFSNTTGSGNNTTGYQALYSNTTGNYNAAYGQASLFANTTGTQNTAFGHAALSNVTTGANNTAVGFNTGLGITTGNHNTIIGANVTGLSATLDNNIIIADGQGNQRINADNTGNVGIGDTTPDAKLDVTQTGEGTTVKIADSDGECDLDPDAATLVVTCSSDERLKSNIREAASVLSEIKGLKVFDYTITASGNEATGLIAQEVIQTNPDMVHMGEDGYYKVDSYNPWKLLKGVQELSATTDNLQTTFTTALEETNGNLELANQGLASLGLRVDTLSEQLESFATQLAEHNDRIQALENRIRALEEAAAAN